MGSSIHLSCGNLYPKLRRHQDCCWCTGPSGKHFDLTKSSLQIGGPVFLAGFPAAIDQELPEQLEGQPMTTLDASLVILWILSWQVLHTKEVGTLPLLLKTTRPPV